MNGTPSALGSVRWGFLVSSIRHSLGQVLSFSEIDFAAAESTLCKKQIKTQRYYKRVGEIMNWNAARVKTQALSFTSKSVLISVTVGCCKGNRSPSEFG